MKTDELQSCPFCGGKATIVKSSRGNHQVWCPKCWAVQMGMFYDTPEAAIAAWNRRASQQAEIERLKAVPEKWVPVSGRLPDNRQEVFIYFDRCGGDQDVGWWSETDKAWFVRSFMLCYNVTHWMPLPEPPEEGEANG